MIHFLATFVENATALPLGIVMNNDGSNDFITNKRYRQLRFQLGRFKIDDFIY
jgi:hypothetical protein